MVAHLRHRWWLRVALVVLAPALIWTQWSADAAVNAFLAVWAVAAVAGVLAHSFPTRAEHERGARTSRMPLAGQGILVGMVSGAFVSLVVQGAAPASTGGLLLGLVGVYDDLVRAARRGRTEATVLAR